MSSLAPRLRRSDDSLARVLASGALARVVTHFVVHPDSALHFRALQRATRLPSRSLQHELARLQDLGMICREREGRVVRYSVVSGHPRWVVFRDLVREFSEPAEVLRVALSEVPGIDAAFLYGSYARKTDVHPASDIDVFVLGRAIDEPDTRFALAGKTLEASGVIGREVNVTRYTPEKFAARLAEGSPFIRNLLGGVKEWLIGDESVLNEPGLVMDQRRTLAESS